jgi:hypothetical protein
MDSIPLVPGDTLLYKFRSLDTDQHVGFVADILLNHRLFAAAARSFNDPFDCDARYSFDGTEAEKIDRTIWRIKKENPFVSDEDARRLAPSRWADAEANGAARIRSLVETELGVVSLAATLQSPLLWAHYASGHTGISIEFGASDLQHVEFLGTPFLSFIRWNALWLTSIEMNSPKRSANCCLRNRRIGPTNMSGESLCKIARNKLTSPLIHFLFEQSTSVVKSPTTNGTSYEHGCPSDSVFQGRGYFRPGNRT